ncbi:MAG TPA: ABC transporter permease [Acidilobales archaeon]|nr:MAG: hypothetical protein B6U85_06155 [Desulfurococcales archaeon ex4484_42]HDD25652.1 ABC transporter permease [Acidilobales archaeon]
MKPLIIKEFKDLVRDPRIWIPFIISAIILPVMALVIAYPAKSAFYAAIYEYIDLGFINYDQGDEGTKLINYLKSLRKEVRINLVLLNVSHNESIPLNDIKFINKVLDYLRENNLTSLDAVLVIPPDFTAKVLAKQQVTLVAINLIRELGFFGSVSLKGLRVSTIINDYLGKKYLEGTKVALEVVKNPVVPLSVSYLQNKDLVIFGDPSTVLTSISFTAFFIPIIIMIISVTVIQMSATSMAVENEEKTLETLLTFPISRSKILFSKLFGSFLVSLLGSSLNIFGFLLYIRIYSTVFESIIPEQERSSGFAFFKFTTFMISPTDLAYVLISIVLMLFFMASLGIVIGALSSDVRIASTLTGPITMFVFVPGYLIAFTDINKFDPIIKNILFSIPITQPMALIKTSIISNLSPYETSIYLVTSFFISIVLIVITAKIFSLETLSRLQRALSRLRRK